MCDIALEIPTVRHTAAVEVFREDYLQHGEYIEEYSTKSSWQKSYSRWMGYSYRDSRESTAKEDWVPTTTLFAVRKEDNKIIGITSIRHNLDQEILREYGGHIGYSVCPGERGKGYGTAILRLALTYIRDMGMKEVMLSCNEENIASMRVIEKCSGVLRDIKESNGNRIRVYWVTLS